MSNRRNSLSLAKSAVMSVALGFISVCEVLEGVEGGDTKLGAVSKALKRSDLRSKAIKRASRAVAREARKEAEEDT